MKGILILKLFFIFHVILLYNISQSKNDNAKEELAYSSNNNYILLISACPPWKTGLTTFCKNGITELNKILKKRMGAEQDNIYIILDEQATYKEVEKGFKWLENKTNSNPNSRAIVYMNLHGGSKPLDDFSGPNSLWTDFIDHHKEHEMFVLWSIKRPATVDDALYKKEWILAKDVRKMLDPINSEKIIIIDSCHAGLAGNDLINNNTREAFIFSSPPLTISQANFQKGEALFTSYLIEGIAKKSNLESAFNMARDYTIITAARNAIDGKISKDCFIHGGKELCEQWPNKNDPYHLLEQVHFSDHK